MLNNKIFNFDAMINNNKSLELNLFLLLGLCSL